MPLSGVVGRGATTAGLSSRKSPSNTCDFAENTYASAARSRLVDLANERVELDEGPHARYTTARSLYGVYTRTSCASGIIPPSRQRVEFDEARRRAQAYGVRLILEELWRVTPELLLEVFQG
jgi:hypothetical protein